MAASLVLLGSLWLPWHPTSENPNSVIDSSGTGPNSDASAWEVFATLDWMLVSACAAPFILSWIIMRRHALSWSPGELTMIVGLTYFVLILCNGVILGKPAPGIEVHAHLRLVRRAAGHGRDDGRRLPAAGGLHPGPQASGDALAGSPASGVRSWRGGEATVHRKLALELVRTTEYGRSRPLTRSAPGQPTGPQGWAVWG